MADHSNGKTFELDLTGCRAEPLASYLKALGVFRIVAEQKDRDARGFWRGEHFVLRSGLDRDALTRFFVGEWRPTPVVAPWNGASGFYQKDNRQAADAIVASKDPRLSAFAEAIDIGRSFVAAQGWKERPAGENKQLMLSAMRARLPDEALTWLDAAVVLGDDRLLFPPLLGTGGNDGHFDFSNNFQQRVVQVTASDTSADVESSIFGTPLPTRFKGTMGQFQPAANERTNPWDFVLLMEGALLFAAAATRRFESASVSMMSFPFHARAAGGRSTGTDGDEDESRDELWLPLWSAPTSIHEIRRLFAEGRATVGSGSNARPASSGLDFARAVSALGVDRGLDGFVRVSFDKRNGDAYFASSLGRFAVRDVPAARLLNDIDGWFDRFRQKSAGKNVPARVVLARQRLDQAMFEAAGTGALGPVLRELGGAEYALAQSPSFTAKAFLHPISLLQPAWAQAVVDGSVEQRLAAALAARPGMRGRLVPLDKQGRNFGRGDEAGVVFAERPLIDNLHALLLREDVEDLQQNRGSTEEVRRAHCSLTDIAHFIGGDVDDALVERWLRAIVLVDGGLIAEAPNDTQWTVRPSASFAVLALVHHRRLGDALLPRTGGVLARACAGDGVGATEPAIRRLNASARPLPIRALVEPTIRTRRIAAALAFPLSLKQRQMLESMVLPAVDDDTANSRAHGSTQESA